MLKLSTIFRKAQKEFTQIKQDWGCSQDKKACAEGVIIYYWTPKDKLKELDYRLSSQEFMPRKNVEIMEQFGQFLFDKNKSFIIGHNDKLGTTFADFEKLALEFEEKNLRVYKS